jgi:hypothetical protein
MKVPSPVTELDSHIFDMESCSTKRLGFSNLTTPDFDLPPNGLLGISSTSMMDNTTTGRSFNLLTHKMSKFGLQEGQTNRDCSSSNPISIPLAMSDRRSRVSKTFQPAASQKGRNKWTASEDDYLRSQVENFGMLATSLR